MNSQKMPKLLKIFAYANYIGGTIGILFSIFLFSSQSLRSSLTKLKFSYLFINNIYLIGIVIILLSILSFFIAKGIFRKKIWAKNILILEYIFSLILFLISTSIPFSVGKIGMSLIYGYIIYYLILNKNVKDFFSMQPSKSSSK